jgi:hypothetical protein
MTSVIQHRARCFLLKPARVLASRLGGIAFEHDSWDVCLSTRIAYYEATFLARSQAVDRRRLPCRHAQMCLASGIRVFTLAEIEVNRK